MVADAKYQRVTLEKMGTFLPRTARGFSASIHDP